MPVVRRRDLLAMLLLVAAAGACSTALTGSRSTFPPPNAQPADVVASYLQALVDGDCTKARALSTDGALAHQAPFCASPRVIAYSELSRNGAGDATELVFAVQLTIRGGDVSLPDGEHTMFVQVLLQPGGAWRINGVGSGP